MDMKQSMAEQATGVRENPHGLGSYHLDGDTVVTPEQAGEAMRENGASVDVPNAGAGSYETFFKSVGFDDMAVANSTASSGDWVFVVRDAQDKLWYLAFQSNRHPYFGFSYAVNCRMGFVDKASALEVAA